MSAEEQASTFEPKIPADRIEPEFTLRAALAGILCGIVFGASNAYLGLLAGLTISTSIPIAVMTIAVFRALRQVGSKESLLEANLAQTVGSASSSVASGVIFTLPALFLWGYDPSLLRMVTLAMCGGVLGILFMIPLRSYLIAREHGRLPYPEGTACAEVLSAAHAGGDRAKNVFIGLGVGAAFKAMTDGLKIIPKKIEATLSGMPNATLGCSLNPALIGVGFILGPKVSAVMVGGGLLSSLILIPGISVWGADLAEPWYPETSLLVSDMSASQIWNRYVRYIGAGAVAMAGFITLVRSVPTMIQSFKIGAQQLGSRVGESETAVKRTALDLPLKVVGIGALIVIGVLAGVPAAFAELGGIGPRLLAAALVTIFAFFFVTVSSRIVGLVGVTSNPTSGMTIASLLGTASLFLALGWTGDEGKIAALCVGCVVAIAASIAGDTSQDLKTGFILGATPRKQQIGEILGVLTSATFVCYSVTLLDQAYGLGSEDVPAPQGTLMKLVIEGVLDQSLPWSLIGIGAVIAVIIELCRLPSLAFAVGVYLPVATMVPVFIGGITRWLVERSSTDENRDARREAGVLYGSGLVGGVGLMGIVLAGSAIAMGGKLQGVGLGALKDFAPLLGMVALGVLIWLLMRATRKAA